MLRGFLLSLFFSLKCKSRWQNELSERVKQKVETVQQYKQVRKRERKKLQRNLRIFFENEKREMRGKLKILKKVQFTLNLKYSRGKIYFIYIVK